MVAPLNPGIIDRLLVVAEIEDLEAIICLNKFDLVQYKQDIKDAITAKRPGWTWREFS